ncbi:hypothetical protein [Mycobacterium sp. E1747]|uniref:hypothetical protein n=1 Tax=Mycobacterium sp. E1747 TaxID=1834128 RepID=UPI0007FEBD82|nr:hypothetical protein [Mycobacterium sp. E1747]OBH05993.1 hypothetical protein A5695_06530 [Mycobacterium sp. E1747]
MRTNATGRWTSAAVMVTALAGMTCASPSAYASFDRVAINGVFTAASDGQFATSDYSFHAEESVTSRWTISSTCTSDVECTGEVSSDQGWKAPLHMRMGNVWSVDRDVPNWQVCPDGTAFTGHQTFSFSPSDEHGVTKIGSPYLEGRDKTVGALGACGRFKALVIVMPFRLDKVE